MDNGQAKDTKGFWELIEQIETDHGLLALILLLIIAVGCFIFWKLIWKVWSEAMKAKDDEIARISKERDKYQALFFERMKSSEAARLTMSSPGNPAIEHKDS
jgi:hypothetical protein